MHKKGTRGDTIVKHIPVMLVEAGEISAGADERSALFFEVKEPTAHLLQDNAVLMKWHLEIRSR